MPDSEDLRNTSAVLILVPVQKRILDKDDPDGLKANAVAAPCRYLLCHDKPSL